VIPLLDAWSPTSRAQPGRQPRLPPSSLLLLLPLRRWVMQQRRTMHAGGAQRPAGQRVCAGQRRQAASWRLSAVMLRQRWARRVGPAVVVLLLVVVLVLEWPLQQGQKEQGQLLVRQQA
jgi:hypothetical protein